MFDSLYSGRCEWEGRIVNVVTNVEERLESLK